MIEAEKMMSELVLVNPAFTEEWVGFKDEWNEEGELPYYLVLGDYARHVKSLHESGEEQLLFEIFKVVEKLHLEGNHYVREAMTIGLLEGIQNITATSKGGSLAYEKYLLPETKYWWDKLNSFWNNGELIEDDRT